MNGANHLVDCLLDLCEAQGPRWATLKKNKEALSPEEREQVSAAGASLIWKAVVAGKTWYVCSTHRAYRVRPTLKGAIGEFDYIETTS